MAEIVPTTASAEGTTVSVNYTVKELLARVDLKVDGLYAVLSSKVDTTEFLALQGEVASLKAFKFKVQGAIATVGALSTAAGVLAGLAVFH